MDSRISSNFFSLLDAIRTKIADLDTYKQAHYALEEFCTGENFLGAGHTRKVYSLNEEKVIKIPLLKGDAIEYCLNANLVEYLIYKRFNHTGLFVPCQLYFFKGLIPVLIADKILPVY